jgi:hypothetical protein
VRGSQLDGSVPRPLRGQETLPPGQEQVPIRYAPPILATLTAAIFLAVLFGLLSYFVFGTTVFIVNDPESGFGCGALACGGLSLLSLGMTLFFVRAAWTAGRDLRATPVTHQGVVLQRYTGLNRGMARGGMITGRTASRRTGNSFWILVGPPPPARPAAAPLFGGESSTFIGEESPSTPEIGGGAHPRGLVQGGTDLGAQLQETAIAPQAPTPEIEVPLPPLAGQRPLEPGEIPLRVDKHVYDALTEGDQVEVVYSPHLQHVYYVRRRLATGGSTILRNLSLI